MNIEILYEDAHILVINKPAGLIVHPDGRTVEPSVSEWFAEKYPESVNIGEKLGEIERPGIVHRIDRETSGALILAKTKEGHAHLKKQFQNREIEKVYHAFLYGKLKEPHGTVNLKIERSRNDFRKRVAGKEGREAITYYKVLKQSPEVTLVEAKPKTGRTHQIRVHFKALHHPVVGDGLYASKLPKLLSFQRLALHARKITFHNVKGEEISVEAPYPEDFNRAIDMMA